MRCRFEFGRVATISSDFSTKDLHRLNSDRNSTRHVSKILWDLARLLGFLSHLYIYIYIILALKNIIYGSVSIYLNLNPFYYIFKERSFLILKIFNVFYFTINFVSIKHLDCYCPIYFIYIYRVKLKIIKTN